MDRTTTTLLLTILATSCAKMPPASAALPENWDPQTIAAAHANLQSPGGVVGTLVFRAAGEGLAIDGTITGLGPGAHGFHVHETGSCEPPGFESAGSHFDPTSEAHAGPTATAHHLGDLGNIDADADGRAEVHAIASKLSLDATHAGSILGRTIVVHAKADDLRSQPGGDAGDRIACGVIVATQ